MFWEVCLERFTLERGHATIRRTLLTPSSSRMNSRGIKNEYYRGILFIYDLLWGIRSEYTTFIEYLEPNDTFFLHIPSPNDFRKRIERIEQIIGGPAQIVLSFKEHSLHSL